MLAELFTGTGNKCVEVSETHALARVAPSEEQLRPARPDRRGADKVHP